MTGPEPCNHQARPVEKNPATVWEVMLKTGAGPIATTSVTAEHMRLDTAEPWTFDFWNDEDDDPANLVAVFPYDAVVGVRRA